MHAMTEDIEAWRRVGAAVAIRRASLRLTQAEAADRAGMSMNPWQVLENARQTRYRQSTLMRVCEALGWTDDSIDRILRGDPPVVAPLAGPPPMTRPGETRVQVDAADGARMIEIPADELRRMRELIDRLLGE